MATNYDTAIECRQGVFDSALKTDLFSTSSLIRSYDDDTQSETGAESRLRKTGADFWAVCHHQKMRPVIGHWSLFLFSGILLMHYATKIFSHTKQTVISITAGDSYIAKFTF